MMVEVKDIAFRYNSKPVLEGISFPTDRHEMTAILGPNGAGKTTLLRCLNRIVKPKGGTVSIEGEDLAREDLRGVAKKTAYVAQRSEPARVTVFDAVLLGRKPHLRWNISQHDLHHTQAALKLLDLEHLSLRYIDELSGGEYQKVCIARAVVQEPKVMLLDEPTASLDLKNQPAIMGLIREIVNGHDMCSIFSMHDLNLAFRYADRLIFLKDGKVYAAVGRGEVTKEIIETVYGVPVDLVTVKGHPIVVPLEDSGEMDNPGEEHPRKEHSGEKGSLKKHSSEEH